MPFNAKPAACLLTTFLVLIAAGCASNEFDERRVARTVAQLSATQDADSLAAAAMLSRPRRGNSAQSLALLARAVALAPERADLLWMQIMVCTDDEACDAMPFAQALHSVDPGNAAPWLPLLNRAVARNEADAERGYLKAMGESLRFDLYWNTSIAHLATALITARTDDAKAALLTIIGLEAAVIIPPTQRLSNACKGAALQESERLETCRSIARAQLQGDTYIVEMIGAHLTESLWPEGSVEYAAAVDVLRVGHYRLRAAGRLESAQFASNRGALEFLHLWQSHRTEQQLHEAVMLQAGVSLVPPADFKDPI